MQRLVGFIVNDSRLVGEAVAAEADVLDITAGDGRGVWGLGYFGHGEMLVQRARLRGEFDGQAALRDLHARLFIIAAERSTRALHLEDAQPLRYRDWLFAISGADRLSLDFVARAQAHLKNTAFGKKRRATSEEATQMIMMDALQRAGVRDARGLTTTALRLALASGAARVLDLIGEAAPPTIAMLLHVDGLLVGLSMGRALSYRVTTREELRRRRGSLTAHSHFRAVVITDQPTSGEDWVKLSEGEAVEIDHSCEPVRFSLT